LTFNGLHGVISQKIVLFITTNVRTSNPTNQNLIHEKIKKRLILGNASYHAVQDLSSPRLSKRVKIKIYRTIILPLFLYGHEAWDFTLKGGHGLSLIRGC
jgi:hypothetical protein